MKYNERIKRIDKKIQKGTGNRAVVIKVNRCRQNEWKRNYAIHRARTRLNLIAHDEPVLIFAGLTDALTGKYADMTPEQAKKILKENQDAD